jgi:predicted component of type VI protein secretion system
MEHQVNGELIPQGGGDSIPLARSPLILGRRESCDICLQFPHVSGKHCELTFREGLWILRDMDSTNGIKINGTRLDKGAKKVLHNGDVLAFAARKYTIQYSETGRASDLDEFGEEIANVMKIPLLEKAGLTNAPKDMKDKMDDSLSPTFRLDDDDE